MKLLSPYQWLFPILQCIILLFSKYYCWSSTVIHDPVYYMVIVRKTFKLCSECTLKSSAELGFYHLLKFPADAAPLWACLLLLPDLPLSEGTKLSRTIRTVVGGDRKILWQSDWWGFAESSSFFLQLVALAALFWSKCMFSFQDICTNPLHLINFIRPGTEAD